MTDQNDDYDPHEHREKAHPISNCEALIHLLKGNIGTGILALPEAFKYAGLILGSVMTIVFTLLATYNLHMLFDSMYAVCKRNRVPEMPYPEAFKQCLLIGPEKLRKSAPAAPIVVNVFIITFQVGVLCVYAMFSAENIKKIVDENTDKKYSVQLYVVFMLLPLLLLCYIKNLKWLAPFSTVANWVTIVAFAIILYFVFRKPESFNNRKMVGGPLEFPLFMGTTLFAVFCIGVMLSLEANMKTPKNWGSRFGVLNHSMVWIAALNVLVGFSGYWKYGDDIKPSITLSLPSNEALSYAVMGLFATSIFISYALQCYPAVEILWEQYTLQHMTDSKHPLLWQYGLRTVVVLATILLAIAIPRLGLFLSLVGCFCLSALGLIFPPFMDLCIHYPDRYGKHNYIFYKDVILIVIGFIGMIVGTFKCVYDIVLSFL